MTHTGYNKAIWVRWLAALGHKFIVHPTAFMVHQPHAESCAKGLWRSSMPDGLPERANPKIVVSGDRSSLHMQCALQTILSNDRGGPEGGGAKGKESVNDNNTYPGTDSCMRVQTNVLHCTGKNEPLQQPWGRMQSHGRALYCMNIRCWHC